MGKRLTERNRLRNILLGLFAACMTTACEEKTVYHSYRSLPCEGWTKDDTLTFRIPVTDSIPPVLHLFAEVRNRCDYPYRDLYLFISQNLQDSTSFQTDTVRICLTDSAGNWAGKGWGSIYQSETFLRSIRPSCKGNYSFKITNGMKDALLRGINDVGIRIEASQPPATTGIDSEKDKQ